jgi:HEAT repeat protein
LERLGAAEGKEIALAPATITPETVFDLGLNRLRSLPLFEIFLPELESPDPVSRAAAAMVLGETGEGRAIEPLRRALQDPNALVRLRAIDALANLGDRAVETELHRIAETDDKRDVRRRAKRAARQLGTK